MPTESLETQSRLQRGLRRMRSFITSPAGVATIAVASVSAVGLLFWAARSRGIIMLGPRSHPGPGRTAVIGDSIVAHTAGFVQYLNQNVPDRSFENFGVVGQGTQAILNDLRNRVIGHGFDEVIIEGGGNDLGRSNAREYISSRLRTMVEEAKAAGLKVVLLTMTPWHQAKDLIDEVNAVTLSQGRSWGADVVVDTHTPLSDTVGNLRSEYASPDQLHPNITGQRAIGGTIQARAYV